MAKKGTEVVDLELHRHHDTGKATRLSLDGIDKNAQWVPNSRFQVNEEKVRVVKVTMDYDMAFEKGFI